MKKVVMTGIMSIFICGILKAVPPLINYQGYLVNQNDTLNEEKLKKIILDIRKKFKIINNNISKYRKKKIELSPGTFSVEGGELIAYFENKKVMKIVVTLYREYGKTYVEQYYWDEKLFFVFEQSFYYPSLLGERSEEREKKAEENRLYFYKNKLIRWLDINKISISPESERYKWKEEEVIKFAEECFKIAKEN